MRSHAIKKAFMKYMWRFQQTQVIIGIIVWSLTLTGIFYAYVSWRLKEWFGITNVTLGMLVLFLIIMSLILVCGFLYDVTFKMWVPQQIVTVERNPYAKERQQAKEIVQWQFFHLPQFRAQARILENQNRREDKAEVEKLRKYCELINNWNTYNISTDERLRRDVKELIELIKRQQPKTFEEVLEED